MPGYQVFIYCECRNLGTRRKETHERPPSADDRWMAETDEECAKAMAQWLKQTINIRRSISSMNIREMKCLAAVAVNTWIVAIGRRAAEDPESDAALIDEFYLL